MKRGAHGCSCRATTQTFHSKNLRRGIIALNLPVFLPRRKVFGEKVCVVTKWREVMVVEVLSGRGTLGAALYMAREYVCMGPGKLSTR